MEIEKALFAQFKTALTELLEYYVNEIKESDLPQVDLESITIKIDSHRFYIRAESFPQTQSFYIETYELVPNIGSLPYSKIHIKDLDIFSRLGSNNSFFVRENRLIANFPVDYFSQLLVYIKAQIK